MLLFPNGSHIPTFCFSDSVGWHLRTYALGQFSTGRPAEGSDETSRVLLCVTWDGIILGPGLHLQTPRPKATQQGGITVLVFKSPSFYFLTTPTCQSRDATQCLL